MNFRELFACTRRTIRGRYGRVLGISLLYPLAWLIFRIVPCILAGVLISQGRMTANMLIFGGMPLWTLFSVLWSVLRFGVLLPLCCGTWGRLTALTGLERKKTEGVRLRTLAAYLRAVYFYACVELQRTLLLLPIIAGLLGAGVFFRYSIDLPEGGFPLFLAAQCLCFAAACGLYYLRFSLGIAAVPFLWLEQPDASPFLAVRKSRDMLRGHYVYFILLIIAYLPTMLPVVTIPFMLPHFMVSCTLFLHIRMREWEQQEASPVDRFPVRRAEIRTCA